MWKKVKEWYGSSFSLVGKEVLIKAIFQAIPTYVMSGFKLPKTLVKDLHMLITRFLWGSSKGAQKIH